MSIVDGTTSRLHCGVHDFSTENPIEFERHLLEEAHYDSGYTPCAICGQRFDFTLEDKVSAFAVRKNMASHPECKAKLEAQN
jgi:hypothetical protein